MPWTTTARRDLPLASVAAGTTWFTMLSWRGFAELWGAYLGPLLLVAAVVAVGGVMLRAARLPRVVGFVLEVLLVGLVVWLLLGGSLLRPVVSTRHVVDAIDYAMYSATTVPSPVPAVVASIAPLMIPSGALALLAVDLLACWVRRVSLAGMALLAVYSIPVVSLLRGGVSWVIFLGSAAGFLLMLFLQESVRIARWGMPVGTTAASAGSTRGDDRHGFGSSTGASRGTATGVGGVAVVIAVVLPLFIPTLHLHGWGWFGPGGDTTVRVVNPTIDLRRNLERGQNVPLLVIHTSDPDPSYLRIAVLTQFNGVEWSTGNRAILPSDVAHGLLPLLEQYLGAGVVTTPYTYTVTATSDFDSTWLPTEFPVSSVTAPGTWHYDETTMDFLGTSGSNTQGITYRMTAAKPQLSSYSMVNSMTAPQQIQTPYTELPPHVSSLAGRLAFRVTQGATSRYQALVKLQDWFRTKFRYSLSPTTTTMGDGNSALDEFLSPGKGGRVGYCQQFASAFAVMARMLSIPARVAVGFLQPTQVSPDTWVYRAHDMHAWPEVFFRGSGWVRFEPTPAARTGSVPIWATGEVTPPTGGSPAIGPLRHISQATASPSLSGPRNKTGSSTPSTSPRGSNRATGILLTIVAVGFVAVLLLVPSAVRGSRRTRRLAGGAEDAWAELRDTAVDLGVSWPRGRSPHETGQHLALWFGHESDGAPAERPARGPGLAPVAESALDRIVLMVEQVRYARSANDVPGALADDVRTCIQALERGSTHRTLRRARCLPRSVFTGQAGPGHTDRQREPEVATPGEVIDHTH